MQTLTGRPVSLGTACTCTHARNWHNDGACTVGVCTCRKFTALPAAPTATPATRRTDL